jgi:hypothetical protein
MQGSEHTPKAPLGNNARPLQPLHHRTVRTNIDFINAKVCIFCGLYSISTVLCVYCALHARVDVILRKAFSNKLIFVYRTK